MIVATRSVRRRVVQLALYGVAAMCALVPAANAMFIVNLPWVARATDAHSAFAYMDLTSTDEAALVGVRCDTAASVRLTGPGKTARALPRLALPAHSMVKLMPGGYRIALTGLHRPIKLGDHIALALSIESADGTRQDIPVEAEVRLRSPIDDERREHHH